MENRRRYCLECKARIGEFGDVDVAVRRRRYLVSLLRMSWALKFPSIVAVGCLDVEYLLRHTTQSQWEKREE